MIDVQHIDADKIMKYTSIAVVSYLCWLHHRIILSLVISKLILKKIFSVKFVKLKLSGQSAAGNSGRK